MSTSAHEPPSPPIGRRGQLATVIAQAVDRLPDVMRSANPMRATLYPGGRADGIVLSSTAVSVFVVVDVSRYGDDLVRIGDAVAGAVATTLRQQGDARPVVAHIEDLAAKPDLTSSDTH